MKSNSKLASIFVDTNLLKYAVDHLDRLVPTNQEINWGGRSFAVDVHIPVTNLPNEAIKNEKLKFEVKLLPKIAALARANRIKLLIQEEVRIESWGLRNMDDSRGLFFGAKIYYVSAPIDYGRVVASGLEGNSIKDLQVSFLKNIKDSRFKQLQKACGAFQGEGKYADNELIDSFFVWCAESCGADYFLTCDFDLLDHVKKHKRFPPKVALVKPSTLLAQIAVVE